MYHEERKAIFCGRATFMLYYTGIKRTLYFPSRIKSHICRMKPKCEFPVSDAILINLQRIKNVFDIKLRAILKHSSINEILINILSCLRSWPWSTGIMENFRLRENLQNHWHENLLIWSGRTFPFCLCDGW